MKLYKTIAYSLTICDYYQITIVYYKITFSFTVMERKCHGKSRKSQEK